MTEPIRSTIQKRDETGTIRHGGEWLAIWSDPNSLKTTHEKREEQAKAKALREIENNIAAVARSMSRCPDLDVQFGKETPDIEGRVTLPQLKPDLINLAAVRGACDAKASFLRFHDPKIHQHQMPSQPDVARLFLILEQCRCAALATYEMPGIETNLVAAHYDQLQSASLLDAHLASLLPIAEAMRMVARDSFIGTADISLQTTGFRMWDQWLRARHQRHFDILKAHLTDQTIFARLSLTFLTDLLVDISAKPARPSRLKPSIKENSKDVEAERCTSDEPTETDSFDPGDTLFMDEADITATSHPIAPPRPYHAFTTTYDKIEHASDLTPLKHLKEARQKLDEKQSAFRKDMATLVTRLQRRLMAQRLSRWDFDLDEGIIDAARLDRVVVNPEFEHVYKQEITSTFRDTCVTLLIDNSGSMRGKQIEIACSVADILSTALDHCGIKTEILGYTTRAWKGGKSAKDWVKAGRPEHPGRLNDLLHIIYKDANSTPRRARDAICAMLSPQVLKENIDGEALDWASKRLNARPEERKLLIVISDGAPVDQATIERNADKDLLDRHLRQLTAQIESHPHIELAAVGIKHDVSPYYKNAVRIDDSTHLGQAIIDLIDASLTKKY